MPEWNSFPRGLEFLSLIGWVELGRLGRNLAVRELAPRVNTNAQLSRASQALGRADTIVD